MSYPLRQLPDDVLGAGSGTVTTTTAGTSILIPSVATGAIYVTSLLLSNGATASTIALGYGVGAVAPTTSAIMIQPVFLAINAPIGVPLTQPIKIPALNNVLSTMVGGTTCTVFATYYIAP